MIGDPQTFLHRGPSPTIRRRRTLSAEVRDFDVQRFVGWISSEEKAMISAGYGGHTMTKHMVVTVTTRNGPDSFAIEKPQQLLTTELRALRCDSAQH